MATKRCLFLLLTLFTFQIHAGACQSKDEKKGERKQKSGHRRYTQLDGILGAPAIEQLRNHIEVVQASRYILINEMFFALEVVERATIGSDWAAGLIEITNEAADDIVNRASAIENRGPIKE